MLTPHLRLEHHKVKKRVLKHNFQKALYNVQNVSCQERSKCYVEPEKKKKKMTKGITILFSALHFKSSTPADVLICISPLHS